MFSEKPNGEKITCLEKCGLRLLKTSTFHSAKLIDIWKVVFPISSPTPDWREIFDLSCGLLQVWHHPNADVHSVCSSSPEFHSLVLAAGGRVYLQPHVSRATPSFFLPSGISYSQALLRLHSKLRRLSLIKKKVIPQGVLLISFHLSLSYVLDVSPWSTLLWG